MQYLVLVSEEYLNAEGTKLLLNSILKVVTLGSNNSFYLSSNMQDVSEVVKDTSDNPEIRFIGINSNKIKIEFMNIILNNYSHELRTWLTRIDQCFESLADFVKSTKNEFPESAYNKLLSMAFKIDSTIYKDKKEEFMLLSNLYKKA